MDHNSTRSDAEVCTVRAEHRPRRAARLLVLLLSGALLWRVIAAPSHTCTSADATTTDPTPRFAYLSVTNFTLGTRTRTVTIFWTSTATTAIRSLALCAPPPERLTAAGKAGP